MTGEETSGPASLHGAPVPLSGSNDAHLDPYAASVRRVAGPWARSLFVPR